MNIILLLICAVNIFTTNCIVASDPSIRDDGSYNPNVAVCWFGNNNDNDNRQIQQNKPLFVNETEFKQLTAQAKINDVKISKIISTENFKKKLIDALVPYAKNQIENDKKQSAEDNEEMVNAQNERHTLSIERVKTGNPEAWRQEGIRLALNDHGNNGNFFSCLSNLEPEFAQQGEHGVKIFDTNESKIFEYLLKKTNIWDTAYKKAAENLNQSSKIEKTCSDTEMINAWWDACKKPDWNRKTMMEKRQITIPTGFLPNDPNRERKYIDHRNKLDAQQEEYLKIYNSTSLKKQRDYVSIFAYVMTNLYAYYSKNNTISHENIIHVIYTNHTDFIDNVFKEFDFKNDTIKKAKLCELFQKLQISEHAKHIQEKDLWIDTEINGMRSRMSTANKCIWQFTGLTQL